MGGALEARGINASNGALRSTTVGEVEKDGRVLVLRRIHVTYHLSGVEEDQKEAVERVLRFHAGYCPVAKSIEAAIDITTELEYV